MLAGMIHSWFHVFSLLVKSERATSAQPATSFFFLPLVTVKPPEREAVRKGLDLQ
jgi:hypothetical protein